MPPSIPQDRSVIYCFFLKSEPDRIRYVGQTVRNFGARWSAHKCAALKGNPEKWDYNVPVHCWIRKHGIDAIGFSILEKSAPELLDAAEVRWIAHFKASGQADLNLSLGGGGVSGWRHTEASRAKMAARVYSEETRAKMSASAKKRGASRAAAEAARVKNLGSLSHLAVLNEEIVKAIKLRLWLGETSSQIHGDYGVSLSAVNHIAANHNWTHVPWPIGPRPRPKKYPKNAAGKLV